MKQEYPSNLSMRYPFQPDEARNIFGGGLIVFQMKRSRLMTVVVMAVLLALLAACSGGGNGNGGDNGDGASEAERRGGDIVVAIMADPDTLDSAATIDATAYQYFLANLTSPSSARTEGSSGILRESSPRRFMGGFCGRPPFGGSSCAKAWFSLAAIR